MKLGFPQIKILKLVWGIIFTINSSLLKTLRWFTMMITWLNSALSTLVAELFLDYLLISHGMPALYNMQFGEGWMSWNDSFQSEITGRDILPLLACWGIAHSVWRVRGDGISERESEQLRGRRGQASRRTHGSRGPLWLLVNAGKVIRQNRKKGLPGSWVTALELM